MTEEVTAMRNPRLTDNDTRNDFHRSLQAMRDTLPRLREDYLYLEEHTADDDLVKAIVAFEQRGCSSGAFSLVAAAASRL